MIVARLIWPCFNRLRPVGQVAAKGGRGQTGAAEIDVQRDGERSQLLLAGDALQVLSELQVAHSEERRLQSHEVLQVQVRLLLGVPGRVEEAQFGHGRILSLQPTRGHAQGR